MNKKYVYNYNLDECNLLFKKGISPIGCGVNPTTNNVYHVFMPKRIYFTTLETVQEEINLSKENVQNWTNTSK